MNTPIILVADHAGFDLKERIRAMLDRNGLAYEDLSPKHVPGDDYPAIGMAAARKTVKAKGRGIFVCGSGVGMAIAANRIKGARAAVGNSEEGVKRARLDDDINILTLSGWNTSLPKAMKLIDAFLKTKASSAARHRRRVKQLG